VALHSIETAGNRYHQRGWTLQEFCSSPRLYVFSEKEFHTGSSSALEISGDNAVTEIRHAQSQHPCTHKPEEAMLFNRVRYWCFTRCSECRPFWIYHGFRDVPVTQIRESHAKYIHLSSIVHTKYQADRIRALYPLIMNCPLENEDELAEAVEQVQLIVRKEGNISRRDTMNSGKQFSTYHLQVLKHSLEDVEM